MSFKFIFCSNAEISVEQEIGSKDFIWLNRPSVLIWCTVQTLHEYFSTEFWFKTRNTRMSEDTRIVLIWLVGFVVVVAVVSLKQKAVIYFSG